MARESTEPTSKGPTAMMLPNQVFPPAPTRETAPHRPRPTFALVQLPDGSVVLVPASVLAELRLPDRR